MNAIVSAASVTSGTAIATSTVCARSCHPDAELIDLVERTITAYRPYWAANVEYDGLFREYVSAWPEKPAALRWSMFSHDAGIEGISIQRQHLSNGKWSEWCSIDDMDALRGPQGYHVFIGPDDQAEHAEWPPVPGQESWWKLNRQEQMRRRADEIAEAHIWHEAQKAALRDQMAVDEAEERALALYDVYQALADQIAKHRATTFDGLRAKAKYLRVVWGDEVPDGLGDDVDEVLESIVRDLLGLSAPSEPATEQQTAMLLFAA